MPTLTSFLLIPALTVIAISVPASADPPPPQPLAPSAQTALANLASDDYSTREAALAKLQAALGEQALAFVASDKPEARDPTIAALQFQDGLTRFLLDAAKLPAAERKARIDFAFQPQILPLIAQIFSPDSAKRVEGIRGLAKIDSPHTTAILGRLLLDPDRPVYVAAMDALWDRTPTDAIVDALWDRAVDAGLAASTGQDESAAETVTFRGVPIEGQVFSDNSPSRRSQDGATACELLIHLQAPHVRDKLKALVETFNLSPDEAQNNFIPLLYGMNTPPMINAFQLLENYKSPELLAALYKIAISPSTIASQGQMRNEAFCFTNHTTILATLITLTGQKPEDYHIKRLNGRRGMWVTSAKEDEDKAVKQLKEWWAANGDKASLAPPATKPAPVSSAQPQLVPPPTLPGSAKNAP